MDAIISLLARPEVRFILTMLGGYLLKANPAFSNKAIPAITLVLNAVITLLSALFGVQVAHAGIFGAIAHSSIWGSMLTDTLIPWVLAHGTHSVVKNGVVEWKKDGFKISA